MLTVVKIGGGLARAGGPQALVDLCRAVAASAASGRRLVIVPGGGVHADVVREQDRAFALRAGTAHRMAILAMDQFGLLLSDLIPNASLMTNLATAGRATEGGRTAILLPSRLQLDRDLLPESWSVTSDSIAGWVAGVLDAALIVLVKPVDGLYLDEAGTGTPVARLRLAELGPLRATGALAGVDPQFPVVLEAARVDTWVINGCDPSRLTAVLEGRPTVGTLVSAGADREGP